MSKDTGHTPVFPIKDMNDHLGPIGLTIRDYFAAKALPSAYAWALTQEDEDHWSLTASEAYNMADAMLEARK